MWTIITFFRLFVFANFALSYRTRGDDFAHDRQQMWWGRKKCCDLKWTKSTGLWRWKINVDGSALRKEIGLLFFSLRRLQKWLARTRGLLSNWRITHRHQNCLPELFYLNINLEQEKNKRACHARYRMVLTIPILNVQCSNTIFLHFNFDARNGMSKNGNKLRLDGTEEGRDFLACVCVRKVLIVLTWCVQGCVFDEKLRVRCSHCANVRERALARSLAHTTTDGRLSVNERAPCVPTYVFPLWCAKRLFFYFFRWFGLSTATPYVFSLFQAPHEAWLHECVCLAFFSEAAFRPSNECIEICNFRVKWNCCRRPTSMCLLNGLLA